MNNFKAVDILLVEDCFGDARLIIEALKEGELMNKVHHVIDGEEAADYLFKRKKYKMAQSPDLIILDLNLPKKNGRELLSEIKKHQNLRRIPVVILTMSAADKDILQTYNLHANCYIVKPTDLNNLIDVINSIQNFWLTIVKLPEKIKII